MSKVFIPHLIAPNTPYCIQLIFHTDFGEGDLLLHSINFSHTEFGEGDLLLNSINFLQAEFGEGDLFFFRAQDMEHENKQTYLPSRQIRKLRFLQSKHFLKSLTTFSFHSKHVANEWK